MIKKIKKNLILIFFLQGCVSATILTPPPASTTIPVSYMFQTYKERSEILEGKIKFSITSVSLSGSEISLSLEFENISNEDLILKKPRSTGFGSADSTELVFNDVYLYLVDTNNKLVNINPTSQFALMPKMRDMIQMDYLHTYEDFILLKPKATYVYKYVDTKPLMWKEVSNSTLSLVPLTSGKYAIYANYENEFTGYYDIPADPGNYSFLIDNNSYIWDLNAWVGKLTSENFFVDVR